MSASTSGFDHLCPLMRNRFGRPSSADALFWCWRTDSLFDSYVSLFPISWGATTRPNEPVASATAHRFQSGQIRTPADLEHTTCAVVSWYNSCRLMHRLGVARPQKPRLITTRASTPATMPGTSRLAQPMAAKLVRRLAPLHWDGSPNQSSGTVRSGPAGHGRSAWACRLRFPYRELFCRGSISVEARRAPHAASASGCCAHPA